MASNAASSVQCRVNGTENGTERTRKNDRRRRLSRLRKNTKFGNRISFYSSEKSASGQPYPAYSNSDPTFNLSATAVHTDGTIFTIAGDSVVVIDPKTGAVISSIQAEHGIYTRIGVVLTSFVLPPSFGNIIVAGDGYAYVPYQYWNSTSTQSPDNRINTDHTDYYLTVLRIGSGGDSTKISVGNWKQDNTSVAKTKMVPYGLYYCDDTCKYWIAQLGSYGLCEVYGYCYGHSAFCSDPNGCTVGDGYATAHYGPQQVTVGNLITNSDQGVVLPFVLIDNSGPPLASTSYLATISTGGGVQIATANVPVSYSPIQPALQAQNGSFVGTMSTEAGSYMVGFDGSGNLKWTVPGGYQPMIATADGGVIAQSVDGLATIAFDANGNANGQMASQPTRSWTGNSYFQLGSVNQIPPLPVPKGLALSFTARPGGNASANSTAQKPITQDVRDQIAQIASSYVGSQKWLDSVGHNKCNIFVQNVLQQAGLNPPDTPSPGLAYRIRYYLGLVNSPTYPALAGDWASPGSVLKCWHTVAVLDNTVPGLLPPDVSAPGDIIAESIPYSDASGHVGIVVGPQQTASADSAASCIPPYSEPGTIDISDYGFRLDTWIDPYKDPQGQPCRSYGKKSKAVVKRFVCE